MEKWTVVAPLNTITAAATLASAGSLLPSVTTAPDAGAGTSRVTGPCVVSPATTVGALRVRLLTPARREAFAELAQRLTAVSCDPAPTARTAIDGAQIVVLATRSPTPVIDADWLEPGAFVTTLGPKQRGRAEFGLDLPAIAAVIATDCVAQMDAYDPPNALVGTPHHERIVSLGALRAGDVAQPQPGRVSLFCSVGLAGTEAFLLDRLATFING